MGPFSKPPLPVGGPKTASEAAPSRWSEDRLDGAIEDRVQAPGTLSLTRHPLLDPEGLKNGFCAGVEGRGSVFVRPARHVTPKGSATGALRVSRSMELINTGHQRRLAAPKSCAVDYDARLRAPREHLVEAVLRPSIPRIQGPSRRSPVGAPLATA